MRLLRRCYDKLHLKINESKSAVTSVFGRKFLGYALWQGRGGKVRRGVSDKALKAFKQRVRDLTRRNGGRSMAEVVDRLRRYLLGVITSYSIHYTKLYDPRRTLPPRPCHRA